MNGFTIGADPELFLKENGKAISAFGMVEGTKESPHKTANGAYQVDGMALEFNIDPVSTYSAFEQFNINIINTIKAMKERVSANSDTNKYSFAIQPTQDFDPEYLATQPPAALELGCDPDFNAYTGEENPRPDGTRTFRTAAGHVHVGWGADIPIDNEEHREICNSFVKMLDATVGMFMTFIDRDPRRREMYGKAGACRYKPYGVEYRTPSNVWIINRERREVMYTLVQIAISKMRMGHSPADIAGTVEGEIERIINEGDYTSAQRIMDRYLARYNASWNRIKRDPRLTPTETQEAA